MMSIPSFFSQRTPLLETWSRKSAALGAFISHLEYTGTAAFRTHTHLVLFHCRHLRQRPTGRCYGSALLPFLLVHLLAHYLTAPALSYMKALFERVVQNPPRELSQPLKPLIILCLTRSVVHNTFHSRLDEEFTLLMPFHHRPDPAVNHNVYSCPDQDE